MRVAVLLEDRCQPKKCNAECWAFCPPVRNGIECIVLDDSSGKPLISEPLCIGCGICVNKCPFDALIINGISTTGFTTDLIEKVTGFNNIEGFSGIITGITTTAGTGGNPLAIQFTVIDDSTVTGFVGLETGYPIYIYDSFKSLPGKV